eukprot:CAMPEP_0194265274 /NCGR_PEP_ID=MMETSP0169-20130528/584_1 /TAXON_ID=218684 /ORGANISM="Corethron pennatum, Strain L29A3" /LENGTH=145 /DNA_ID=CAMNT_0039005711 /DNA_START=142 /DNA_END=576 /DNA_ORIENTATION=+
MRMRTTADEGDGDSVAVPSVDDCLIYEVIPPTDPPEVPTDLITEVLPCDILMMTFEMLPVSHRFLSPVCRRFRDLYGEIHQGKKSNTFKNSLKKQETYKYSIATEVSLELYLEEACRGYNPDMRKRVCNAQTSYIGAGCGRRDWV